MVAPYRFPERLAIRPRGPVDGTVRLPGSKSLTNRALLCATLAGGTSTLIGALDAEDTRVMMKCLTRLGGSFAVAGEAVVVAGTGGHLLGSIRALNAAASGTTARFLTAAATLADGPSLIDGTPRMRRRPIGELVAALQALGADVEALGAGGCPPVRVGGGELPGGHTVIDARRSSQFVSAIALAAPYAKQDTSLEFLDGVLVSRPYVESTVEVMRAFGAHVELDANGIRISRGRYQSGSFHVEPDASAAAYPLVAAAITGGSVQVPGFRRGSRQADLGILDVLAAMGCAIEWSDPGFSLTGPADGLTGVDVDMGDMPDAVLAVAVAGAFASGPSRFTNIANLRIKESDRLAALAAELRKLGADTEAGPDRLVVRPRLLHGAEIDTYDDHRMAMAFSLAGLVVPNVVIRDPGCVVKTWPTFFEDMGQLWPEGGNLASLETEAGLMMDRIVVAIDGPGGAGKTTVSKGVAARLDLPHLDTGAFYRAAALVAIRGGIDLDDAEAVIEAVRKTEFDYHDGTMLLGGEAVSEAIRSPGLASGASRVSAIPGVRELLVARQQAWVDQHGGAAVVEGRDIGTVVFPEAPVKIFLTARPEIRAARRAGDLKGEGESLEGIAQELERRDHRDSTRLTSPLRPASDAVEVDTSDLRIDEVIARIVELVTERVGKS
ncbi:MAG: 3-phosphoshikimate 1-carboxyvinyltransferase [Acidimicrobiia bacterium]|nr:3-phosphoshikimate 1-carboxyvinyltransferase [Acidimicrobiia bacterium]